MNTPNMSLRDHFAAQALAGLVAVGADELMLELVVTAEGCRKVTAEDARHQAARVAERAYLVADAMLIARTAWDRAKEGGGA